VWGEKSHRWEWEWRSVVCCCAGGRGLGRAILRERGRLWMSTTSAEGIAMEAPRGMLGEVRAPFLVDWLHIVGNSTTAPTPHPASRPHLLLLPLSPRNRRTGRAQDDNHSSAAAATLVCASLALLGAHTSSRATFISGGVCVCVCVLW
jgi:hypothetical protein